MRTVRKTILSVIVFGITVLHQGCGQAPVPIVTSITNSSLGGDFEPPPFPPNATIGGYPMPTLEDEKATYQKWGWTWTSQKEPSAVTEPIANFVVKDPDIHGDTEGDDLWTYLMMYIRTGNKVYWNRAQAWAKYFKEDYRNCIGSNYTSFCYDKDGFGMDHLYGWGLIAWYEYTGDQAALIEAENIGAVLETFYSHPKFVPGTYGMSGYGARHGGRHLMFTSRLAEVTKKQRWGILRDKVIDLWVKSPDWDPRGMYFATEWSTDTTLGQGEYAAGTRMVNSFMLAVLMEGFAHAYRTTQRADVREKMIAMAYFVNQHGIDAKYQYSGSLFGFRNGKTWHNYLAQEPVTFIDPVYTTALVNTLMWGYKLTGDPQFKERAKHFFNRGTKGVYGQVTQRAAADNQVAHFVDTVFDSSQGNFYLSYNKGELAYTYLLFEQ